MDRVRQTASSPQTDPAKCSSFSGGSLTPCQLPASLSLSSLFSPKKNLPIFFLEAISLTLSVLGTLRMEEGHHQYGDFHLISIFSLAPQFHSQLCLVSPGLSGSISLHRKPNSQGYERRTGDWLGSIQEGPGALEFSLHRLPVYFQLFPSPPFSRHLLLPILNSICIFR